MIGARLAIAAAAVATLARTPEARAPLGSLVRVDASAPQMGTLARVVVYAASEADGQAHAAAAFARIAALDARLSDYRDDSEVAALARASAGVPIAVSDDLFAVLAASEALARRTGGAFDITAGRLTHLWRRARRLNALPEASAVEAARAAGGYTRVRLDRARRTVTLAAAGIEIDAGAIAKGYAADEALRTLAARGAGAALVAIGGDIAAGDPPPGRRAWTVAVPRVAAFANAKTVASAKATAPEPEPGPEPEPYWIALTHAAVSTSGDAEQWMTAGGVRHSHVIDLRTGWPVTGRRSTSVVARHGIDADALSTAIGILGDAAGEGCVRAVPGASALWQAVAADGAVGTYQTSTWPAIAGPASRFEENP